MQTLNLLVKNTAESDVENEFVSPKSKRSEPILDDDDEEKEVMNSQDQNLPIFENIQSPLYFQTEDSNANIIAITERSRSIIQCGPTDHICELANKVT